MGTLAVFRKRRMRVKMWKFAWETRKEIGSEDQGKGGVY